MALYNILCRTIDGIYLGFFTKQVAYSDDSWIGRVITTDDNIKYKIIDIEEPYVNNGTPTYIVKCLE